MTRFPVDLTERDWAVLDCYGLLLIAFSEWVHEPSWFSAALGLAVWWMAVYFQWAAKVRRFDPAAILTRIRCEEAGHPITFTGTHGSGCACGKVKR